MPQQYRALQGFIDTLPEDQPYWKYVEQIADDITRLYGYRRIETPILEDTAIFRKTSGEGTDIVEKEMYSFDDRPDREGNSKNLSLRPEGTAGVVRSYLEHGMFKLQLPVKLYYINAPMFRRERPQAGRFREHRQFGCEALGETDAAVDAEMIGLVYQFYTRLGLKHIRVKLNSIGDPQCRPNYIHALKEYFAPLLATSSEENRMRFDKNPLRLLDSKEPEDQQYIANAPKITDYLCDECKEHFAAVRRYLDMYGVPCDLDPLLVRGLDYYTRTVFEFTGLDRLALSGGGRYDGLVEILGGEHTPGIGFGAGVERIVIELKKQGIVPPSEPPTRVFVANLNKTPELKDAVVQLVADLRHAGIKAEMAYGERSFKAQMKRAGSSNAEYVLVIGEDELAQNVVNVRHSGEESVKVGREDIVPYLLGEDEK